LKVKRGTGPGGPVFVTDGPLDISAIPDTLAAEMLLLLTPLLFGLSFLSGMLGLGVAFIAIPVLGLFGYDLISPPSAPRSPSGRPGWLTSGAR
jgi:hypothetical protein